MDLAIRGGEVVIAGGRFRGDIGIRDGRVERLGAGIPAARTEIDATDKLVLPGGVDMHVHLSPAYVLAGIGPGGGAGGEAGAAEDVVGWADDFSSGSRAAAAGGITTIGNMTFPHIGEAPLAAVERVEADAARDS